MKKFLLFSALCSVLANCVSAVDFAPVFNQDISAPAFVYGGKAFDASKWKRESKPVSDSPEISVREESYTSPDGLLKISQTIATYKKFKAVEWKTRLENVGGSRTQIVENFNVFSLTLKNAYQRVKLDGVDIRRMRGSDTSVTDFTEETFRLERRPSANALTMENVRGYSSSEWMPYIGLDFDATHGIDLAIGWSGNWRADFAVGDAKFTAQVGMRKTRFFLEPKESVIQPSMLVMFRNGATVEDAQNLWRAMIFEYFTPRGKDGKPFPTPIVTSGGGNSKDEMFLNAARVIKERGLGFELLGVDAGWFGGPHEPERKTSFGDWAVKTGDWRTNTLAHPDGLKKISAAARNAGMLFSLWCEIERVMPAAPLYSEHPEYITKTNSDGRQRAVLNLGNPDAWKSAFDTVSGLVDEIGVDVWRIDSDYHVDIAAAWKTLDAASADREGIAEAKHVEGFYKLWDELKKKYPHIMFDNCASGGKRLDYESLSRSFSVWRSDTQCYEDDEVAEASQLQNYYLCSWLPSHSGGNGAKLDDDYKYVSSVSSGMMIPAGAAAREANAGAIKKRVALAKRMRGYFLKDFYRLTARPEDFANWCAYQAHDPAENAGFFIAFRRKSSPAEKEMLHLRAISPASVYELEDKSGNRREIGGGELKDFIVSAPPRDYALYFYRKIK